MDTSSPYFRFKWSLHIALLAEIYDPKFGYSG